MLSHEVVMLYSGRGERNSLLSNLDEGIARHILNSFVRFVCELKEFVDHSLEKFPMRLEESGILPNNVHDI